MADKVKLTNEIKLVAGFVDGDDRTIAYPDPKSNVTKADIMPSDDANANGNQLTAYAKKVLVGDKTGAAFKEWKSAQIVNTEITNLDLTSA